MKTTLVSFSFARGGAAIAAKKFATMASQFSDVECYCAEKSNIRSLSVISPTRVESYLNLVKRILGYILVKLMADGNPVKHSLNLFSSANVLKGIRNRSRLPHCALNIHWFNNDALSIWRLGALPIAAIITMHDEWLYCGAEHYYAIGEDEEKQFQAGYRFRNKSISGLNWNYFVWKTKHRQITKRKDLIITAPSNWMLERAKSSAILHDSDIRLLPNPIETDVFFRLDVQSRQAIRKQWSLTASELVIAFGAVDGEKNYLKGGHLLRKAFSLLDGKISESYTKRVRVLLFGGHSTDSTSYSGFSAVNLGKIASTEGMREVYNAADFVVVPSMVESFGQVAAESLACETPVVAFAYSGLLDIVQHEKSGYLAQPHDPGSLSECIAKMIQLSETERSLKGRAGREHVMKNFSAEVVSAIYKGILVDSIRRNRQLAS